MTAVRIDDGPLTDRLARLARGIPDALAEQARALVDDLRDRAQAGIQSASGALARSLTAEVAAGPAGVAARLTSALPYAAYQDRGFVGTERVEAHLRQVSVVYGHVLATPAEAVVGAFTRRVAFAGTGFLSGPFAAMEGEIVDGFRAAVEGACRS